MSIRIKDKEILRQKVFTVDHFDGIVNWSEFFNNNNPIVLDAGCGKGEFVLEQAILNPDKNYIAVDYSWKKCLYTQKKMEFNQISNVLVIRAAFEDIFEKVFSDEVFSVIHMNFPDPWPKKKHNRRRSLKPWLVDQYIRMLKKEGDFYFVTDSLDYAQAAFPIISEFKQLVNQLDPVNFTNHLDGYFKTLFCQKAEEKGVSINYMWFKKSS